jgi:hypothetical protein
MASRGKQGAKGKDGDRKTFYMLDKKKKKNKRPDVALR